MLKVLLARLAHGGWERTEVGDFLLDAYAACAQYKVRLMLGKLDQCPTTCARNTVFKRAQEAQADVVCMVDNDMAPPLGLFDHALKFLAKHKGAVAIGSPYCGAPPKEEVQVVIRDAGGTPVRMSREDAARRTGDQLVYGIGTGVWFCNKAALTLLEPPQFEYVYDGVELLNALATEDIVWSERFTEAGGRIYAAFDYWSGHAKTKVVGRPTVEEFEPCTKLNGRQETSSSATPPSSRIAPQPNPAA